MAKKKEESAKKSGLKSETLQGILAVCSFALSIFFGLAAFGKAGVAGDSTYQVLESLFGVGYVMLPVVLLVLAVAFLKSFHRKFSILQTLSAFVFFLSGLGLVSISFGEKGGKIGQFVAWPLLSLFKSTASIIFLVALLAISFLALFDTGINIGWFSSFMRDLISYKPKKTVRVINNASEDTGEEAESQADVDEEGDEEEVSEEDADEEGYEKPLRVSSGLEREDGASRVSESPFKYLGRKVVPIPLNLLEKDKGTPGVGDIKANVNIIKRTLQNFGIDVEMDEVTIGPTVT